MTQHRKTRKPVLHSRMTRKERIAIIQDLLDRLDVIESRLPVPSEMIVTDTKLIACSVCKVPITLNWNRDKECEERLSALERRLDEGFTPVSISTSE